MEFLLQVLMPTAMFAAMLLIGTELSREDFSRLRERPWLLLAVSICQLLLLPAAVCSVFLALPEIPTTILIGMLIMSAGPGGGLSNLLTAKAGGNVALSIALTSLGSLCCTISMPAVFLIAFPLMAERAGKVDIPTEMIVGQLVLFMLVPVCLGMWVRQRWPSFVARRRRPMQRGTSALVVTLILYSLTVERAVSLAEFAQALPYAVAFMSICAGVGWCAGAISGTDWPDKKALMIEYAFQSAAIPTLIVAAILQKMDWMVFVGAAGALQLLAGLAIVVHASLRPLTSRSHPGSADL